MGHRKLQRVPLDFDWPLHTVWKGYVNPYYVKCAICDGSGRTLAREWFENWVHMLMIMGEDSRKGRIHPWLAPGGKTIGLAPNEPPGPELAVLTAGLAGREPSFFGHDGMDRWNAEKKIVVAAGLLKNWGWCPSCEGEGIDPSVREAHEGWQDYDPPTGPGFQLWRRRLKAVRLARFSRRRKLLPNGVSGMLRFSVPSGPVRPIG